MYQQNQHGHKWTSTFCKGTANITTTRMSPWKVQTPWMWCHMHLQAGEQTVTWRCKVWFASYLTLMPRYNLHQIRFCSLAMSASIIHMLHNDWEYLGTYKVDWHIQPGNARLSFSPALLLISHSQTATSAELHTAHAKCTVRIALLFHTRTGLQIQESVGSRWYKQRP